ncbi:MAG: class I SAM-dependent methyltransferase [Crocinitomicaceae bacterium]
MSKEWFEEWFNTKYYHQLYSDRDDDEAALFIRNLVSFLKIDRNAHILDLACGKGRHSIFLNELGYNVTGVDLSSESIAYAKEFENETLHFFVQDMREAIENQSFSHIFNLFTSFGYFDTEKENLLVLKAIEKMLQPKGIVVIDFLNSYKALTDLVENETLQRGGIDFHIHKSFDGAHIFKNIQFSDEGNDFDFTERVQALTQDNFIQLFNATGLQIIHTFGDFDLRAYDKQTSNRLILIAEKK